MAYFSGVDLFSTFDQYWCVVRANVDKSFLHGLMLASVKRFYSKSVTIPIKSRRAKKRYKTIAFCVKLWSTNTPTLAHIGLSTTYQIVLNLKRLCGLTQSNMIFLTK